MTPSTPTSASLTTPLSVTIPTSGAATGAAGAAAAQTGGANAQQQQSGANTQQSGADGVAPIRATPPMWRCSRIMHMQRDLHPTILSSLEGIVDQVSVTSSTESTPRRSVASYFDTLRH